MLLIPCLLFWGVMALLTLLNALSETGDFVSLAVTLQESCALFSVSDMQKSLETWTLF